LFKFIVARGVENLLAVTLVLAFFMAFMGLLSLSFPQGTSLGDLMGSGQIIPGAGPRGGIDLRIEGDQDTAQPNLAILSQMDGEVRDKPSGNVAWNRSRTGLTLEDQHAVQTFERSRASIRIADSTVIDLDENALIVLRNSEHLPSQNRRVAALIVLEGMLRGRIDLTGNEEVTMEIESGAGTARLQTSPSSKVPTDFSVKAHDDASSTFSVFSGEAEVKAEHGSVVVRMNHALTVDAQGRPGSLVPLPPVPALRRPAPDSHQRYRSTRTRVTFEWTSPEGSDAYRLTVARDAEFRNVLHRERVTGTTFTLGNLKAGHYYWRVRGLRDELEGADSPTRRFRVVEDRRPPKLEVIFPEIGPGSTAIEISGQTDPGVRVFISGEAVVVDDSGVFSHTLILEKGVNLVVVEAVDDTGNVTYRSQTIHAK